MKLQELLDQYPRVKVSNPQDQEPIFSLIDQTSITSEALQISFERKPDFYHFLKAQGDHAIVFKFVNKDGTPHGFAASTFRRMCWNGQPVCIGYTSDLRTTPQLDREARLQWRKFYGHGVGLSQEIDEFDNCIGFVTAVWNENKLAQKALVSTKKRPGDFSYEIANTYHSQSIWGRWRPLGKPSSVVRPIQDSEMETLHKLLCNQDALSWNEDDLKRSLSVFQKSLKDFQVLEESGLAKAFVLPVSTSKAKKTLVKKWPPYLKNMAKLLPIFGKRKIELNVPIEVLQLMLFKSVMGDEDENLGAFIDHFWYQNNQLPKSQQFSILAINRWDKPEQKSLHLKEKGYLFTSIEGALYKVTAENTSPVFKEINDFSHLEVGFL